MPVDDCKICHDLLDNGEKLCILFSCTHPFHTKCMEQWIDTSREGGSTPNCPICKIPCEGGIRKLFLNFFDDSNDNENYKRKYETAMMKCNSTKYQNNELQNENKNLIKKANDLRDVIERKDKTIRHNEMSYNIQTRAWKKQKKEHEVLYKNMQDIKAEKQSLEKSLEKMEQKIETKDNIMREHLKIIKEGKDEMKKLHEDYAKETKSKGKLADQIYI